MQLFMSLDGIDNDNDAESALVTAQKFSDADFDTVEIEVGSEIVVIDENNIESFAR